jgi:predicted AAA+ superfamily ATPase
MESNSRIAWMKPRRIQLELERRLAEVPAVVLLGPRQVGKTTLALAVAEKRDALYLDLESEADRAKLAEPELYLSGHLDRLVVLDEVHRTPGLFPVLRGLIDRARRAGRRHGLYLLLGSAALDLLRQSGETLAGRVSYLALDPFDVLEVGDTPTALDRLWLRGGFPESFLAADDGASLRWREDFIRTYLERDIPQFGRRIAADRLRRLWTMLAHLQGGLLNVAQLARNLGVDAKTAAGYLDLLIDLLLLRRLPPWHANLGKRLVRSPKVYLRDSGLVHALLAVRDREALLSHPIVGASWEGFVIENLLNVAASAGIQGYFYRTSGGAEIDLLLAHPDGRLWAVEIKRSLAPRPERGFHSACADLAPERCFLVYPGTETYPVGEGIEAIPLRALAQRLAGSAT